MSITSIADLNVSIARATSESIPNGEIDLPLSLEISDVIRSRKLQPKEVMRSLKKRIADTSYNPNLQLSSWKLVEVCIKNGGTPFIVEICSREFMDLLEHTILKANDNSYEKEELLELTSKMFYELYIAFKNDSQLNYVARVHDKLISRGVKFPEHATDVNSPMAMFDSKTPADWIDSDACMICSRKFSMLNRRHHCRSCGGIFCQDHSSHFIPLPDLGIYEEVRVCDNCFEDYDLKKHDSKKSQGKPRNRRHRRKNRGNDSVTDDYDEEEQLRKAIELSLKESTGSIEPIIPVIQHTREPQVQQQQALEDEEDADLKAAIQQSLVEAEEEKRRRELQNQQFRMQQMQTPPSFELSATEEEDIYLFASLVERMKTQSMSEILEDTQLQKLYQKVIASKPKLNNALNDKINKYNTLIDMNAKISDIMNIYDNLLEEQLRNINLSQQYVLPPQPSDPYAAHEMINVPPPQQTEAQPQHVSQYYRQEPAHEYQQVNKPLETQPTYANQLQDINLEVQTASEMASTAAALPYPKESEIMNIPSEPVYPTEEVPSHAQPQVTLPYPSENDTTKVNNEQNKSANVQNITQYEFPTVPASKVTEPQKEEEPEEEHEPVHEEELLLEL
ncbi:hypothetical protein KAFR_0F00930 [Kazachstania africana CBS 2517]|uniref:Vacuolar protein sorting-associated protein 27 n=1 Tax=Kazachstania africana (strain ATCC 22294 / BCRC 22015 / CBS 2517 / CECT 1963 / NBRC 1671 / NRRL Y-8276) TaxID=1071382 RepID=H2AWE0_KAZAF|nr:hypothetical protein KAFR_0F00930 [Kazachstania africana CBS 2517]CCF58690.1 hypothetical protein KAFR_0F00930 [Kazachstania africana CBS 2517]